MTDRMMHNRMNNQAGCGCGCGGGGKNGLADRLREVDFAIYETVLYLDAYPESREALAYYHSLIQTRKALLEEYQSKIGPVTVHGNKSTTSWDWVQTPWPWEMV